MHERSLVEVTVVRVLCDFLLHQCAGQMIPISELQSEVMPVFFVALWVNPESPCKVWKQTFSVISPLASYFHNNYII